MNTKRPLFRQEVVASQSDGAYGPILINQSIPSWCVVTASAAIVIAVVLFLSFASYAPRTTVSGLLVPNGGVIRITAPASGVIAERRVHEGQQVRKGDTLFVIEDQRGKATSQGNVSAADVRRRNLLDRRASLERVRDATSSLNRSTGMGLSTQISNAEREIENNRAEIALLQNRIERNSQLLGKYRTLAKEGFFSDAALQEREDQALSMSAGLLAMQRSGIQLLGNAARLRGELTALPVQGAAQLAGLDRELGLLLQEATESAIRDSFSIVAPKDGVITAINAEIGQIASAQTLASVVQIDTPLVAHLFANSKSFAYTKVGQVVRIRFSSFPYQQFGQYEAIVTETSLATTDYGEVAEVGTDKSAYRITAKLIASVDDLKRKSVHLLAGMKVEADLMQDKRLIISWILHPTQIGRYL